MADILKVYNEFNAELMSAYHGHLDVTENHADKISELWESTRAYVITDILAYHLGLSFPEWGTTSMWALSVETSQFQRLPWETLALVARSGYVLDKTEYYPNPLVYVVGTPQWSPYENPRRCRGCIEIYRIFKAMTTKTR